MRWHLRLAFFWSALAATTLASAASEIAMAGNASVSGAVADASAIGRVHPGSGRYCTGTLVAANIVVTAAHCLVDPRSRRWIRAESLHFLGGYSIGEYDYHARVARYTVSPGYNADQPLRNLRADWAMLFLTDVKGEGTPIRSRSVDKGAVGEVTGYALQRKYALSTSEPCKVEKIGFLLMGECKALAGMSGAPLLDVTTGEMLGIQVAAGNRDGRDVMVVVPASNWSAALASNR